MEIKELNNEVPAEEVEVVVENEETYSWKDKLIIAGEVTGIAVGGHLLIEKVLKPLTRKAKVKVSGWLANRKKNKDQQAATENTEQKNDEVKKS